jgi:transcriptional/translational regulatory protein YebC/TACO1
MFSKKGSISVPKDAIEEEKLIELALDLGAEDVDNDPESHEFEVRCDPDVFEELKKALEEKGISLGTCEVAMVPQTTVHLEGKAAETMLKMMAALDDNDDVQNVWANFDIPDEVLESFNG